MYSSAASFRGVSREYPRLNIVRKSSALSALILGLRLGAGKGRSPWGLENVPGVDWTLLFDKNGFSKLHKIVYGVDTQPLDAELEARPEDLERPDCTGLTALWYACWLGNSNHIRILIKHGADVNNTRMPPICAAVWSGSYDSVEQLLNAGASITDGLIDILFGILMNLPGGRGEEYVNEVLAIDKALFGRFLDVNYRAPFWEQAPILVVLAQGRQPYTHARMRQLLELGADTELADGGGRTALCRAISTVNAEGCKILGRAGANGNVKTNQGHTILHLVIECRTDADTIQAVSELDLSDVDLGAKDTYGYTAFELLKARAERHRNDQHRFPKFYPFGRAGPLRDDDNVRKRYLKKIDTELQILLAFQTLLQQVQEAQGIPIEDRYPLLNLTRESLMFDQDEGSSSKNSMPSVPGAWPND